MSNLLLPVPAEHRAALENWIAQAGTRSVASCLAWLANYQLHRERNAPCPTTRLYGLTAPELLHLSQDLAAAT